MQIIDGSRKVMTDEQSAGVKLVNLVERTDEPLGSYDGDTVVSG